MRFKLRQLGSIRKLLACANCTTRVLLTRARLTADRVDEIVTHGSGLTEDEVLLVGKFLGADLVVLQLVMIKIGQDAEEAAAW